MASKRGTGSVQRISISLAEPVFLELDRMVAERGLENRSKAIAEMISRVVLERREATGDPVMSAGELWRRSSLSWRGSIEKK